MDTQLTIGSTTITVRGHDEPGAVTSPNFPTQIAHIEDALRRLPAAHLAYLPAIEIGDRPASGGGFYSSPPRIGLNRGTFGVTWNRRWLFTLLHESGHAVDRATNAVARFASECGGSLARAPTTHADWVAYRAIHYGGRNKRPDGTPAYGEHFAEGYAHMLTARSRLTTAQQRIIARMAGL